MAVFAGGSPGEGVQIFRVWGFMNASSALTALLYFFFLFFPLCVCVWFG